MHFSALARPKPDSSAFRALEPPPLAFVESVGQWATDARFVARQAGVLVRGEDRAIGIQFERDDDGIRSGAYVRMDDAVGMRRSERAGDSLQDREHDRETRRTVSVAEPQRLAQVWPTTKSIAT